MTVDDIRKRVQEIFPRHQAMRGFLGAVKHIIEDIRNKGLWSFDYKDAAFALTAQYTTGTVAVVKGDETVTGTGTTFVAAMIGRKMIIAGVEYEIASITSTTILELTLAYTGNTDSGLTFAMHAQVYTLETDVRQVSRMWDTTNKNELSPKSAIELRGFGIQDRGQGTGNARFYSQVGVDASDVHKVRFWPDIADADHIFYIYEKAYTQVTGVASSIDMPPIMDETVIQGVYARLMKVNGIQGWETEVARFKSLIAARWIKDEILRDKVITMIRQEYPLRGNLPLRYWRHNPNNLIIGA